MGGWGVALALGLPWLAGALWVRALWPASPPGVWPLALGYGYLLGLFGVALLLRLQAMLHLPLWNAPALLLAAVLAGAGLWRCWNRCLGPAASLATRPSRPVWHWSWLPVGLLWLWLAGRLTGLALEAWWQPLFPWDAWTTWALRARIWLELGHWVEFAAPETWLMAVPGDPVQALDAWHYPTLVSLLALWPTLAYGGWNEAVANLPWVGAALALGLGFYGQARLWGASPLTATVFLWLLGTLPLLDTHVALAGYADLWLAAVLGLGLGAGLHWLRDGGRHQAGLALLLLAAGPWIKQEGLVWLLLVPPALLAARIHGRGGLLLAAAVMLAGLVWWFAGGLRLTLPGGSALTLAPGLIQLPGVGRFALAWHDSWKPVLINLFVLGNWHLFGYLLVLALLWSPVAIWRAPSAGWLRAGLTLTLTSLLALFVLFFWTDAWRWAEAYTSLNRLLLHFVPWQLFWMLTLWQAARTDDRRSCDQRS